MPIDPNVITSPGSIGGLVSQFNDISRRVSSLEASRTTLAPGSVAGSVIVDGSLDGSAIAAGSITGTAIAPASITTALINAGAITSSLIAANAITANHISSGAITTDAIAANAITSAQIAAGTITASDIQSSTITTNEIAANTITGTNIAGGTITSGLLASGAVTSDKIVGGAITSDKISVTQLSAISTNMGAITAGTITGATVQTSSTGPRVVLNTGGITAYGLDGTTPVLSFSNSTGNLTLAGTVTANAQSILPVNALYGELGGSNLLTNSGFENAANYLTDWSIGGAGTASSITPGRRGAGKALRITASGATPWVERPSATWIPIQAGRPYTFSGYVNASAARNSIIGMAFYNNSNALVPIPGVGNSITKTEGLPAGAWYRQFVTALAPVGATKAYVYIQSLNAVNGDTIDYDDFQLEEADKATAYMPKPDEILPGTIRGGLDGSNSMLAAGTIIGSDLLADTITASQIATSAITAVELAANAVTAGKIAAGTITATEIQSGSITADRLNVTTLSAITANLGTITAGTITGATFQTAAIGARVVMDSNGLRYLNAGGIATTDLSSSSGGLKLTSAQQSDSAGGFGWAADRAIRFVDPSDNVTRTGYLSGVMGTATYNPSDKVIWLNVDYATTGRSQLNLQAGDDWSGQNPSPDGSRARILLQRTSAGSDIWIQANNQWKNLLSSAGTSHWLLANANGTVQTLTATGAVNASADVTAGVNMIAGGYVQAPQGSFSGNVAVNTGNTTGGGIILSDDGTIVDLNDGFCSFRFSSGIKITDGKNTNGTKCTVQSDGSGWATNWVSTSDRRLKKNIQPIVPSGEKITDKLKRLRGVKYDHIDETPPSYSVIAQELQAEFPHAVQETNQLDGLDVALGVKSLALEAILLEAVKELMDKVDYLESQIKPKK